MNSARNVIVFASMVLTVAWAFAADAEELRIVSWGGAVNDAFRVSMWQPFEEATGIDIIEDSYNGEFGRIRAQVESGNIQWDIVEAQWPEIQQGCLEGLFETIDVSRFPVDDLLDGAVSDCAVKTILASAVLAYNPAKFSQAPTSWADFWDVERFPGKRGLRRSVTETIEIALLADGVPQDEIYDVLRTPEGQDRAFRKLDELKPHIVWWSSGTEQVQGLLAGDYDMAMAWNGRVATVNAEEDAGLEIAWEAGHVLNGDQWAILKGTPNKEAAQEFLVFAVQAEPQAEFMRQISYGQINKHAYDLIPESARVVLPTAPEHVDYAVWVDPDFYLEYREALTERFNTWVSQ